MAKRKSYGGGAPSIVSAGITVGNVEEDEDDEEESERLGSGPYKTIHATEGDATCMHCGAPYTPDGLYHGYYCEDCRDPNGFHRDDG